MCPVFSNQAKDSLRCFCMVNRGSDILCYKSGQGSSNEGLSRKRGHWQCPYLVATIASRGRAWCGQSQSASRNKDRCRASNQRQEMRLTVHQCKFFSLNSAVYLMQEPFKILTILRVIVPSPLYVSVVAGLLIPFYSSQWTSWKIIVCEDQNQIIGVLELERVFWIHLSSTIDGILYFYHHSGLQSCIKVI